MISIRPMTRTNDPAEAFVKDTWVRSLYDGVRPDATDRQLLTYLTSQGASCVRPYVLAVLALPRSQVFIAGAEDDPQLLLGYVCAEPGRVHYVYVKKNLRRRGISDRLLTYATNRLGPFKYTSTLTRAWTHDWARKLGLAYDPIIESERKSA